MSLTYAYELNEDEGVYVLDVPKFPEIVVSVTHEDIESAQVRSIAEDAVRNALQARIDYNDEIPDADAVTAGSDVPYVSLSPLVQSKILLYKEYRKRGGHRADFAKVLGVTQTTLSRIFDLSHNSRFDVVIGAFESLGLSVEAEVRVRSA